MVKTPEIRNEITLRNFIIMPNHFHAIVEINKIVGANGGSPSIKSPLMYNSCDIVPQKGEPPFAPTDIGIIIVYVNH